MCSARRDRRQWDKENGRVTRKTDFDEVCLDKGGREEGPGSVRDVGRHEVEPRHGRARVARRRR